MEPSSGAVSERTTREQIHGDDEGETDSDLLDAFWEFYRLIERRISLPD